MEGMTSWVVLRHLVTDTLGGSLGGGSFEVKVDIDRNRISADGREYSVKKVKLGYIIVRSKALA